jgi:hypothetical protein
MKVLMILALSVIVLLAVAAPGLAVELEIAPGQLIALERLANNPQADPPGAPETMTFIGPLVSFQAVFLNPQPEPPSRIYPPHPFSVER